jgi:hypothetical protein
MIQLIEAALASATCIVVASLWFSDRVLKRERERGVGSPKVFAEKRRLLERDRAEWSVALASNSTATQAQQVTATRRLDEIDKVLMAIADEEGHLDEVMRHRADDDYNPGAEK